MVMVTDEDGITSSKTLKVIVRDPTLNGTAGDDVFRVSLDATGKIVQFFENVPDGAAPPTFTSPAERVAALSVNGSGGSDRLIIDGGAYPFATDLGLATPGLKVTVVPACLGPRRLLRAWRWRALSRRSGGRASCRGRPR